MEQAENQIDSSHAKILARAIYRDIAMYIQSHQDEYQEYIMHQEREDKNEDSATHRHKSV